MEYIKVTVTPVVIMALSTIVHRLMKKNGDVLMFWFRSKSFSFISFLFCFGWNNINLVIHLWEEVKSTPSYRYDSDSDYSFSVLVDWAMYKFQDSEIPFSQCFYCLTQLFNRNCYIRTRRVERRLQTRCH